MKKVDQALGDMASPPVAATCWPQPEIFNNKSIEKRQKPRNLWLRLAEVWPVYPSEAVEAGSQAPDRRQPGQPAHAERTEHHLVFKNKSDKPIVW